MCYAMIVIIFKSHTLNYFEDTVFVANTIFYFFSKELEKETTERVKSLFEDIDKVLYADDGVTEKGNYNNC